MPAQLFVNVTSHAGSLSTVNRAFQVRGNISIQKPVGYTLISKRVSVQVGAGPQVAATFVGATFDWECNVSVSATLPWSSVLTVTVFADATFRFLRAPKEPDFDD